MNNDDFITIELPDMKIFKSLKKDKDPFMKFWDYVTDELGTIVKGFDVCSVKLTQADYDVLEKYAKSWFKKQSYHRLLNDRKLDSSFGFHALNISPSIFFKEDLPRLNGFIYVKTTWKETQQEHLERMAG